MLSHHGCLVIAVKSFCQLHSQFNLNSNQLRLPLLQLMAAWPWTQLSRSPFLLQAVLAITLLCLPREFHGIFTDEPERIVKNYYLFFCVASGLWGGLTIGLVTEYYTSNAYAPVKVGRGGVVL